MHGKIHENTGQGHIINCRCPPTKISLAFIFFIVIMRALPQLRNSIAAFCSSFSDLSLARMQIAPVYKKLIKKFWVFRLATMFYAPVNRLPVQLNG